MLARASLGKESYPQVAAKTSPKSPTTPEPWSAEQEHPIEEFTPPKFAWSIGNIAMSAPGDSDPPTDNNANQSRTTRMVRHGGLPWPIQAKLEVGAVDDPLEREADRVAEQVMRMPEPTASTKFTTPHSCSPLQPDALHKSEAEYPTLSGSNSMVQRKCSCGGSCDKCKAESDDEHGQVQRKPATPQISAPGPSPSATGMEAPRMVHEVLRSPGQPLDAATRAFFEPRFGYDFSNVRVHAGAVAAKSARGVQARAYTVGQDIVFGSNVPAASNRETKALLAHELSHVVQQEQGSPLSLDRKPVLQRQKADEPDEPLDVALAEQEAFERFGERIRSFVERLAAAEVETAERDVQVAPFFVQEDPEVHRIEREIASGRSQVPAQLARLQRSLRLAAKAYLQEADDADELQKQVEVVKVMNSFFPTILGDTEQYEAFLKRQKAAESDVSDTLAFLQGIRQQIEIAKRFLPERAVFLEQRAQFLKTQAQTAAKKAGVEGDTEASLDQLTLLRTIIEASPTLMPYLTQQRAQRTQPTDLRNRQRFNVHLRDDDFKDAVKRAHLTPAGPGEAIGGFYDRPTDTIHLPRGSKFGHALHEAIHKYSPTIQCATPIDRHTQRFDKSTLTHCNCGFDLNEGLTQYFADVVLTDQKLPKFTDHAYKDQLTCAEKFVKMYHLDNAARLYFLNDSQGALDQFVQSKRCANFCSGGQTAMNESGKAVKNEAETVAAVSPTTSDAASRVQRKCACGGSCDKCQTERADNEREQLQQKSEGSQRPTLGSAVPAKGKTAPPIVHDVLRSAGHPLDSATRAFFEPRFGRDLSRVRIHSGPIAERSARDLDAQAFTVGSQVVFGRGRFAPETREGKSLLAHELTHTIQQTSAPAFGGVVQRAPKKDEKPAFRDCTEDTTMESDPRRGLVQALDLAQRFVNGAIGKLAIDPEVEPKGSSYRVALERHFLNPSKAQRKRILDVYQAIYERLKPGNVRCAANDQELATCAQGHDSEVAAFMRDGQLVLCFNFWSLSPLCRATILIHESAHAAGLGVGKTHPPYRRSAQYPSGAGVPSKDQTAAIRMENPDAYAYFAAHVWRDIDTECIPQSEIIDIRSTKDAIPITRPEKEEERK